MFGIDEQWNHELLSFLVVSSTAGSLTRDLSLTREELEPTDGALLLSSPSNLFTALSFASSETLGLCRAALSVSAIFVRLFGDDMVGKYACSSPSLACPASYNLLLALL